MRRLAGTLAAAVILADWAAAQAPPDVLRDAAKRPWLEPPAQLPPLTPPAKPSPNHGPVAPAQKFETSTLRLKRDHGQWQLWAGTLLLKDFGTAEADAYEALQVFRDLRVNARGSVGGVFEYWLADGRAPSAVTRHRQVIPFDAGGLRAEQVSGSWVLRDARVILFNFGSARADAEQALAVCRQYGFNQLGYVGHPVPSLKYLMTDPTPRATPSGPQPVVPVSARMQATEAAHPRLVVPSVGDVGERVPVDATRLDLRRQGGHWVLFAGRTPLAHYGTSERDGRLALQALQQFRVTELCRVGDTGFGFFLANGRAPQGTIVGTGATAIRADKLSVRQLGTTWAVCDGYHPLIQFGDKADDARRALAVLQAYRFDHVLPIDPAKSGHLFLFVKSRY